MWPPQNQEVKHFHPLLSLNINLNFPNSTSSTFLQINSTMHKNRRFSTIIKGIARVADKLVFKALELIGFMPLFYWLQDCRKTTEFCSHYSFNFINNVYVS